MKFSKQNIENLAGCLTKMERFFAFKYEIPRSDVGFVIKGNSINVMIEGKLRETIIPKGLEHCSLNEETGLVTKGKY